MPCAMKIQPIDFNSPEEALPKSEAVARPVLKSRFKWRLFDRPFLKLSAAAAPDHCNKCGVEEFEPSSVCLGNMVQNFIEESNDKQQQQRCGKNRCNCFNGIGDESSDEEPDSYDSSFAHACEVLKSLVLCSCVSERNLLADTAKIVDRNKISKRKDDFCRKVVVDGLLALGYNAAICKSKWDKSPSFPAGEYEFVDVMIEGERIIIDIDFRSEFEIARSTKAYRRVLQTLPNIFVGKSDRLEKIIGVVSEAAKQSLKKKGMPLPPWRKADYVKAKWLSPFTRISPIATNLSIPATCKNSGGEGDKALMKENSSTGGELELILEDKVDGNGDCVFVFSNCVSPCEDGGGGVKSVKKWEPPEIKPKIVNKGVKIVTGLASVIEDKP